MPKTKLGMDVYAAARERIAWTFDTFDRVTVSFSAGKDSTVMLHMAMDEAIKRGRTVGVLIVDLEAQYELTMDHASRCFDMYSDNIEPAWVCLDSGADDHACPGGFGDVQAPGKRKGAPRKRGAKVPPPKTKHGGCWAIRMPTRTIEP